MLAYQSLLALFASTPHPFRISPFVSDPSQPSRALQSLHPIELTDLKLGATHRGRVLHGILCVPAFKVTSIFTCLQVENGLAVRVAIYNAVSSTSTLADVQRLFPKGLKVAIKEPHLKRAADGKIIVRVDNPANVEKLETTSPQPRRPLDSVDDINKLRLKGNVRFRDRDWEAAITCYSGCIEACLQPGTSVQDEREALLLAYSNRAEAWMQMENYEQSLADSVQALKLDPNHLESLLRRGKSLHGLRQYHEARACLNKALRNDPTSKEIQNVIRENEKRCSESDQRELKDVANFLVNGGKAPKCADFIGPVVIRMTSNGRGRGLFVSRDVKAGDRLLVSNPMAICHQDGKNACIHLDMSNNKINTSSQEDLVSKVLSVVMSSPKALQQLYSLAGVDSQNMQVPSMEMFQLDGDWMPGPGDEGGVDIGRIREIVRLNSFGGADSRLLEESSAFADKISGERFSGLWLLPSFINHSCLPNATGLRVGEAMFIHATRDIQEGHEITIPYFDNLMPLKHREKLYSNWGFSCECKRCILERLLRESFRSINSQFDALHDIAVREASTALRAGKPFPADLPRCAEFAGLAVQIEEKMETLPGYTLTPIEKEWLRASFSTAYLAGLQSNEFLTIHSRQFLREKKSWRR